MKRFLFFGFSLFTFHFLFITCFSQPVITYWNNDSIHKKSEENFKKGMQDGHFAEWYKSGKLAKEGNYNMGAEEGIWKAWYENGQQKSEEKIGRAHV